MVRARRLRPLARRIHGVHCENVISTDKSALLWMYCREIAPLEIEPSAPRVGRGLGARPGQRGSLHGQAGAARTALAKHIVEMAREGERDRQFLIEGALLRLSSLKARNFPKPLVAPIE
jgi:hypothetical protein